MDESIDHATELKRGIDSITAQIEQIIASKAVSYSVAEMEKLLPVLLDEIKTVSTELYELKSSTPVCEMMSYLQGELSAINLNFTDLRREYQREKSRTRVPVSIKKNNDTIMAILIVFVSFVLSFVLMT